MPQKIKITAGKVLIEGELNDSSTARSIVDMLPISGNLRIRLFQEWVHGFFRSFADETEC